MDYLNGKTILVTGGTGSFGNTLIDYLGDVDVRIIVFSRDEEKQHSMYISRGENNVTYVIGDVRDKQKLIHSMHYVDYVFHAAALKHVPTGENFPEEVINTNILGTKNVIEAAEYCGVKKVVTLSTDKAVYPINAYGMSKALAEKLVSAHKGQTIITCLRYGNVLGSRGSVVPLFLNLIKKSEPLTITNPKMTRFLLTLSEAIKLALKCLSDGNNGDLFVIKSPACSIQTLVEALELHFEKKFSKNIIGIRTGEKMDETLLTSDEVHQSIIEQGNGVIFARVTPLNKQMGDYYFSGEDYREPEAFTSANTELYDPSQTLRKIREAGLL
ncbi:polysaccharide biosynthesis protein [Chloroflexota bacterium]